MNAPQMLAYNTSMKKFLKRVDGVLETTSNPEAASGFSKVKMQLYVETAKKMYPGNWLILRRQDALKIRPCEEDTETSVVPQISVVIPEERKVEITFGGERSEGCEEMISLMTRLEAVTSAQRLQELTAKVSDFDKTISEMYHYIESHQLNAAKGYKAYRNLRKILLERRKVKNEISVIQRFRAGKIVTSDNISQLSSRLWSADIEEMMNR